MRFLPVALLSIACSSPPVIVVPDAGTNLPDAGEAPDAGSAPDGGGEPQGLVFRLKLISDVPESIYVQESGGAGTPEWITLYGAGDTRLEMFADCAICSCDECRACGVCGMALPVVAEIRTNESHDLAWDARIYPHESCAGGSTCWRRTPLASGSYRARFCWGTAADGTGPGHWVANTTCTDVPFTYPVPGGVVEHVVDNGG